MGVPSNPFQVGALGADTSVRPYKDRPGMAKTSIQQRKPTLDFKVAEG